MVRTGLAGLYDRHVLPHLVDLVCGGRVVEPKRRLVVPRAAGRVLELGFGSGLNLAHYDRTRVESIWALEPSAAMRRLAADRIAACGLAVRLLDSPAEELALPDRSVDTVVVTFSLCTIPDPLAALRQARRVLRPGGAIVFCEHGAAPHAGVRRWQDRLDGVWSRLAGGCHLNRDPVALLGAAGFEIDALESGYLPGAPRVAGFASWGRARLGAITAAEADESAAPPAPSHHVPGLADEESRA